ncbi:hypothetical protein Bca4012_035517 [Brassica carinata]|uniref:Uncharacterized protein n=1 Tax=Brassica carinata TaxID=52824 RepID=A0A8X8BA27_BRACI|nr:hypothetical protein Bca52824_009290 [Brassica carinata]
MTIDLRTVECLRGRLLAERQVSRSVKEQAELITRKDHKVLRNQSNRVHPKLLVCHHFPLHHPMKKKEENRKLMEMDFWRKKKVYQATENVDSMGKESSSKLIDVSSSEASVVASTSSHEGESQAGNNTSTR